VLVVKPSPKPTTIKQSKCLIISALA